MKRFLVLLILVAAGAVVLNERYPRVHELVPWLPHVPWLQARLAPAAGGTAGTQGAEADATGQGGRNGRGGRAGRGGGNGPIPVLVAQARFADLPVTVDILGTVQATNTATVKSQVDGKLIEIDFADGQDVKKGDVLARIDPATFQAQYDQAIAKKAQDDSVLANAQVDLTRYVKLAETQYGSHQQADTQRALVTQTQAIVQQDQAAMDNAKAILNYTTIRSPLDGRTGIRLVDQGNIVHAADATGIVTVAQVRPIAVVFSLPQQYLRQVNAAMAKGSLRAEAFDGETHAVLDTGVLQVVDNAVDQTTGTVKLKGSFPNADLQLWPGQFVNVRLYIDKLTHVVVVATSAVQRGPDGAFVYVVNPDNTVSMQKVEVGRQTDTDSVVTAGLTPPATVVTTGFTRLTDKAKVAVSAATASAATSDVGPGGGEAPATGDRPAQSARPDRAGGSTDEAASSAAPADAAPADGAQAPGVPAAADGTRKRRRGNRRSGQDGQAQDQGNAQTPQ